MDGDIAGSIILQIVLIAINAIFACVEIAVVSVNDTKLEKMVSDGNKKAMAAAEADLTAFPFPGDDSGRDHTLRISGKCVCSG